MERYSPQITPEKVPNTAQWADLLPVSYVEQLNGDTIDPAELECKAEQLFNDYLTAQLSPEEVREVLERLSPPSQAEFASYLDGTSIGIREHAMTEFITLIHAKQLDDIAAAGNRGYAPNIALVRPVYDDHDWKVRSACRTGQWDLFYPEGSQSAEQLAKARRICMTCSVRAECLDVALKTPMYNLHGIWAGMTKKEIEELKEQPLYSS